MQYLKDEQYYIDLYDLFTVKDCLDDIEDARKIYQKMVADETLKDKSKEEIEKAANYFLNWQLFATKTSRYQHKAQRIAEMFESDRKKQDFYDNAPEPSNVTCNSCGKQLVWETKILEDYMDTPMRVLFYFPCTTCKQKRAIYNTGEEYESKPSLCPKCSHEIDEKHTIKDKGKSKVITWIRTCPVCKFTETEIDDFEKSHAEFEKKEKEDKEQLAKYREEFCLSKEKGDEYVETIEAMQYGHEVFEEEKQKYDNTAYQTTVQLKRLSIVELEKLFIDLLEKERFVKLTLSNPEIGQFVIVPFTLQDADSSRKGRDSVTALEKFLKPALEQTNWRLVTNSVSYRLGFVSGQLKGYEHEEDLLKLSGFRETPKPKSKPYNSEKEKKYGHNNYVQLMRMFGKHEGIENVRKRRLEKEPDGFFLEATEGPFNCGICGELTPGNRIWWNVDGLRCADCWRNINDGVIPSLKHMYDNDNTYFQDWQFSSQFGLHSATVRKLKKEGLLHARELKRQNGNTYCSIYLSDENQEFLKKYPRKPKMQIQWKMKDNKGNEINF